MLTPTQKTLVQDTFATIVPTADDAAALFYRRLFELDPTLRRMFPEDLAPQRKKLVQTLAFAVKGLNQLEQVVPGVRDLGRRHAAYGVEDAQFDTVGDALLWTLEKGLGEAFTPEARDAWAALYRLLATEMKDAMRHARAAA